MKIWKVALWLCVIPMLSMVGTSWVFSLDFWANASGNATVPNQDFVQTAVINQVNLGSYYCINDSVAIETADLNSISAEPLVYYNNASNKDLTFYLNSSASIGLNDVCEVFIKPSEGLTAKLTPDILQNYGRPANETEYYLCIKYLKQEGRCKTTIEVS
jgi:hypothetical protein